MNCMTNYWRWNGRWSVHSIGIHGWRTASVLSLLSFMFVPSHHSLSLSLSLSLVHLTSLATKTQRNFSSFKRTRWHLWSLRSEKYRFFQCNKNSKCSSMNLQAHLSFEPNWSSFKDIELICHDLWRGGGGCNWRWSNVLRNPITSPDNSHRRKEHFLIFLPLRNECLILIAN